MLLNLLLLPLEEACLESRKRVPRNLLQSQLLLLVKDSLDAIWRVLHCLAERKRVTVEQQPISPLHRLVKEDYLVGEMKPAVDSLDQEWILVRKRNRLRESLEEVRAVYLVLRKTKMFKSLLLWKVAEACSVPVPNQRRIQEQVC